MATRAACASTNFTTATTWATVDATSFNSVETTTTALTTAYQTSTTFTPGAITIDGIGVRLSNRTGTTGTITVALDLATADVAGTVVTINCSDLPAATTALLDGCWIFFKFAAPVTLAGATAYGVKAKTSSAAQVSLFSTATTNWARYLRTTTTGAPAAGDDLIIAKEWTAAATGTARSVTMDQTAATDYGSAPSAANGLITPGIAICQGGTLVYGTTAATAYLLQLSNSLIVYNGGTLNIGTTGTPIPRGGSAVLQFDLAADGDYGLVARNGSTVNLQGLSRTSGKNVVSAKLTADSSLNLMRAISGLTAAMTVTGVTTTLDPTGTSLGGGGTSPSNFNTVLAYADTVANSNHKLTFTGVISVTNTTQIYTQWVKRGTGTNNRFVRLQLATATTLPATDGFYADFDLQTPSAGTCTALGTGTATSATITALGAGFVCTIVGKIASTLAAPVSCIGACNASGVVSYAGDATQNFLTNWPEVFTASSQPTDTIDTDTGWLSGDVVAVASTTRTAGECEVASLASNAGASTLTYNLYPVNARSGTTPTQAEVILLTRNVKVRSTSSLLNTYVQIKSGAAVDIDWTEFYYLGVNVAGQGGVDVEVNTTAVTNFSMQFSSIHDTKALGFRNSVTASGGTLTSLVFSSNTLWNLSTTTGPGCQNTAAITATNWTFDSNVMIRTGNGNGWTLSDVGGTFTNNTAVGAAAIGINFNEATATVGTFSGNVAHSNVTTGLSFSQSGLSGTVTNYVGWRNNGVGLGFIATANDVIIDSAVLFGNTTDNIVSSSTQNGLWFKALTANGDTTFATTNGVRFSLQSITCGILIDNGDFSTVSGIKTAHTNDINISLSGIAPQIVLRNTKLGAATEVATPSNLSNNGFIASEKHDQTAGNHMTWMRNGLVQTDSVVFNSAAPSMLMTPTSATLKLESAPQFQGIKVPVANGGSVTATVFIRKSATYNGNQPRLIVRANPAIGIAADAVLATYSGGTGAWASISGATAAVTDAGEVEFIVDCDGTVGAINVDDWSTTGGAQDNGGLGYWFNGLPAQGFGGGNSSSSIIGG